MSEVTPGDRDVMAKIMIEGIPTTDMESDAYVIADWLIEAGFRRVSPVTREALVLLIRDKTIVPASVARNGEQADEVLRELADDILALLSVSPPAEVEWEYAQISTGFSFPEGYPTPCEAHEATHKRTKAIRAGQWVPVTPGEGKEH